jgi:hypothetical protein
MLNIGGLSKMSHTNSNVTLSYISFSLLRQFKHKNSEGKNGNFCLLQKKLLNTNRWVEDGAGAASEFCPEPEPHKFDLAPQLCLWLQLTQ